jgi:hypothetical protein
MTMGRGFEVTTFSFQNDFIVLLFLGKKMKKKLKNFSRDFKPVNDECRQDDIF